MPRIEPSQRRQSGHAMVWLLVVVALFAALIVAGLGEGESVALAVAYGCTAVAGLGIAWEFRSDPFEAARTTAQLAFIVAFFASLPLLFDDGPTPVGAWAACLGSVAVGLGCWIYRAIAHRATDRLPNLLLERFDRGRIHETAGIQFAFWTDKKALTAGERFDIHVMAQSCWDEPRRFGLKIGLEGIGRKWQLVHDPTPSVEIGGGEAVLLTVPVLTHPKAKGTLNLNVVPDVGGRGGTRVRRFRARTFEPGSSGSAILTALFLSPLLAIFMQAAASRVPIKVRKGDKNAEPPAGPLPVEVASLYVPEPTELKAIAMGVVG